MLATIHRVLDRRKKPAPRAVYVRPRADAPGSNQLPPPHLEGLRKTFAIVSAVTAVAYLVWRLGFTLNTEQIIPSVVLFLADALGAVATVGFALSLWKLDAPAAPGPIPEGLTVDVWIPTYNEDLSILRRTIYHCVQMDYPHTTWVLDDGHRPEVRALAESLGARYLSRPDNKHGKAGNLNYAYAHTSADVIASFDADFVPQKDFLTRLLGYFADPKTALVQVPQRYYNADSFQHRLGRAQGGLWSEQGTFFDLIMTGRNRWNAAYWIGTNAILRREAVKAVGGFSTDSIVEDMLTGLRLHAGGWRSVYVNEALAFGLAPAYLSQFLVQRMRWSQGAAQVLRRQNPLFTKGLSLAQRICYLSSVLHFFEGFAKHIYYFTPAFFFLFGVTPIAANDTTIAIIMTYVALQVVSAQVISRGRVRLLHDELFAMIRYFTYLLGNLALFTRKPLRFKVTPKGDDADMTLIQFIGPMLALAANLAALVVGSVTIASEPANEWTGLQLASLAWCVYFVAIAVWALIACLSRPSTVGFAIHDFAALDVEHHGAHAEAHELCVTKAWGDERIVFWSRMPYRTGARLDLRLHVRERKFPLVAKVVRSRSIMKRGDDRVFEYDVMLDESTDEAVRLELVDLAFRIAMLRQERRFSRGGSVNFFPLLVEGAKLGVGHLEEPDRLFIHFANEAPVGARFSVVLPGELHRECTVVDRAELDGETFLVTTMSERADIPNIYDVGLLGRPRRVMHFDGLVAASTVIATAAITWGALPSSQAVSASGNLVAATARASSSTLAPTRLAAPTYRPAPAHATTPQLLALLHGAWSRTLTNRVIAAVPAAEGPGAAAAAPLIGPRGEAYAFLDAEDLDRDGRDGIDWAAGHWKRAADPFEHVVVSEAQSYRMLQAVLLRDRASFARLWEFARDELQHANLRRVAVAPTGQGGRLVASTPEAVGLGADHLFAWRWHPSALVASDGAEQGAVIAAPREAARDGWASATDADQDIALALIWASRAFVEDPESDTYLAEARAILADLWAQATFEVDGERHLAAWPGARCVAPGYLSPASYRVFARVDPNHDWGALVTSTYRLIERLPTLAAVGDDAHPRPNLPPGFVQPLAGGALALCPDKPEAQAFGADSMRLLFRVALDARLFEAPEARAYLAAGSSTGPHDFLRGWIDGKDPLVLAGYDLSGRIPSAFELDGRPRADDTTYGGGSSEAHRANAGHYGAYLAFFSAAGDLDAANRVLAPLVTAEGDPTPTVGYAAGHVFRPASQDDGWLRLDATGTHWTVYDHSDWDATYDYYGNIWAWLGLALHAGLFDDQVSLGANR